MVVQLKSGIDILDVFIARTPDASDETQFIFGEC